MIRERVTLRRPDGTTKKVSIWHAETAEDLAKLRAKVEAGEIEAMIHPRVKPKKPKSRGAGE